MPDDSQTQQANDPGEPSPTSEAEDGGKPGANAEDTGFRYGADAPPELQGKTPQEAAQQYSQLRSAVQQYVQNQQTAGQQQQTTPYQQSQNVVAQNRQQQGQQNQQAAADPDPDVLYEDPAKWQQGMQQWTENAVQQQIASAAQPLLQSNAETAKRISKQENREVWDKWGAEVEQLVAGVPLQQRANTALWDQAAQIVKSNHVEELAAERAKALAAQAGSETEGGDTARKPSFDAAEQTAFERMAESEYGARLLDEHGPRVIEQNCREMGITLDEYAEMCSQTDTIRTHGDRDNKRPDTWKAKPVDAMRQQA